MAGAYLYSYNGVNQQRIHHLRTIMRNIYMERALELAKVAYDAGEIPVGAVVVRKSDGMIIGEVLLYTKISKISIAFYRLFIVTF